MIGRPPVKPEIRFFQYVRQDGDCWMWTGGTAAGYGMFWDGHARVKAHRWVYGYLRSPIPDGLQMDHLCRVTRCVNPWHLEPVDSRTNVLRSDNPAAKAARQTHCIHGHQFVQRGSRRVCLTCRKDIDRRHRERQKETTAA